MKNPISILLLLHCVSFLNCIKLNESFKQSPSDETCNKQVAESEVAYILFRFSHSLRISDYHVEIEFLNREKSIEVRSISEPMPGQDSLKWASTRVDEAFKTNICVFERLAQQARQLNDLDFSHAKVLGMDGNNCSIEFKTKDKTYFYSFWTPDYNTKARGLREYLELCEELLREGGFNPKKIL